MNTTNNELVIATITNFIEFATDEQKLIANNLGLQIPSNIPKTVFAAKLRKELSNELCIDIHEKAPDGLINYSLQLASVLNVSTDISDDISKDELSAWTKHLWSIQNLNAFKTYKFEPGDVVSIKDDNNSTFYIISSFSTEGMVYFKGGKKRKWAGKLKIECKATERNDTLYKKALNDIELHSRSHEWTIEKADNLKEYEVSDEYHEYIAEEFDDEIRKAKDESPLQRFLEKYPQILCATLIGNPRYLMSQKRFGAEFVPDFLLADVDSIGIKWTLVELETPNSGISLASKNDFDQYTRKGISQIKEWREWLLQNLSYASKPTSEKGLGLTGIRPDCDGLILVGKRSLLNDTNSIIRRQIWESDRIRIRTYDGLLETLETRINDGFHPRRTWFIKENNHFPFDR